MLWNSSSSHCSEAFKLLSGENSKEIANILHQLKNKQIDKDETFGKLLQYEKKHVFCNNK
jgi:hypothetical protein